MQHEQLPRPGLPSDQMGEGGRERERKRDKGVKSEEGQGEKEKKKNERKIESYFEGKNKEGHRERE